MKAQFNYKQDRAGGAAPKRTLFWPLVALFGLLGIILTLVMIRLWVTNRTQPKLPPSSTASPSPSPQAPTTPPNQQQDLEQLRTNLRCAGCNLNRSDLQRANLPGADLEGAYLIQANLQGANLVEAKLSGTFLMEAQLQGAYLDRVQITGTHLSRADLTGASLTDARLEGVNLSRANLTDVDLSRSILIDTNLINGIDRGLLFNNALFCKTIMPNGKVNNTHCNQLGMTP